MLSVLSRVAPASTILSGVDNALHRTSLKHSPGIVVAHMSRFVVPVLLLTSLVLVLPVTSAAKDNSDEATAMKAVEEFASSKIVKQKSCVTCHTIGKSGGTVGPVLNLVSNRRSESWLRA